MLPTAALVKYVDQASADAHADQAGTRKLYSRMQEIVTDLPSIKNADVAAAAPVRKSTAPNRS